MNELIEVPDILITDYDRTLIYLYRDTNLLIELAQLISEFYNKYFNVPDTLLEAGKDGYLLWHKLHTLALEKLSIDLAEDINKQAENIVTNFEFKIAKSMKLLPRISETIKELNSMGIKLGIVSSNSASVVQYSMEDAGILNMFEYIAGRECPFDPKLVKPNPFPINKAIEIMKPRRNSIWYVGDDIIDMQAASSADVIAVGVCTGNHSELELRKNGAKLVFKSFADIPAFLKER